ncbi:hypothetical protein SYNTR_0777 [Candidatus Syntrophocurvum alkaliphilum]|uniref:DUF4397 domain-containing protein n=1 Tax=Candidatus Syntrophocurvum alkaliphilum TaxID=2293317 RepID=A0A6I6DG26_9FIRM|nr:DUF4397 domain-containing protein [Candidatus Syntrophocurvum alkaliphilum]QGT99370.1 hypothetical protein SYNTR_0777 [Candidatus Syntrophocurvum alkaliphilum]
MENNKSLIRVLHASPCTPPVDVYADGNLIVENLAYKDITDYLPVEPGMYNIQVFPTGVKKKPVIDVEFEILPDTVFTLTAIGVLPDVSLLPIASEYQHIEPSRAIVRFAHLVPDAPNVDIGLLESDAILFSDVAFTEVTDYIAVDSGVYDFEVRPASSDVILLNVYDILFEPGKAYTLYAVGLLEDEPPLQAIYFEDFIPWLGRHSEDNEAKDESEVSNEDIDEERDDEENIETVIEENIVEPKEEPIELPRQEDISDESEEIVNVEEPQVTEIVDENTIPINNKVNSVKINFIYR